MLSSSREFLLRASGRLGVPSLVAATPWRQKRLMILCYHGVSQLDEHEWNPQLYVSQSLFRDRLRRLRADRYNILPLGEAVARLQAGDLPPRSVAVTFDDGHSDFVNRALPVLREFDVPATVYVLSSYACEPLPVFNPACAYLLWKGRHYGTLSLDAVLGTGGTMSIATAEARAATHQAILRHVYNPDLPLPQRDPILRAVAESLGVDYDAWRATRILHLMQREEIAALPRDLIDVQLHTHRHRVPRAREALQREITENRGILDTIAGRDEYVHLAYPNGDYDVNVLAWLREVGVRTATTCEADLASPADDPLLLPRFLDSNVTSEATFDAWASGLAPLLGAGDRARHTGRRALARRR